MTPAWLARNEFEGAVTISDLRSSRAAQVPTKPGVYVVYRDAIDPPGFVPVSTGGWFKGRDPSVGIERLKERWVESAHILYIGKADAGKSSKRGLRVRLDEYLRFGAGSPIGHWGGRLLWHLDNSGALFVSWRPSSNPRRDESELLAAFSGIYGRLPFANLRK